VFATLGLPAQDIYDSAHDLEQKLLHERVLHVLRCPRAHDVAKGPSEVRPNGQVLFVHILDGESEGTVGRELPGLGKGKGV